MDFAFQYVKDNKGIDTEASYNYTAKTGKTCLYNATNIGANLTSWVDIPQMSEAVSDKLVSKYIPIFSPTGPPKSCRNSWPNLCGH